MAKGGFIDLGKKPSNELAPKPANGTYYPTTHISGVDEKLSVGDEVMLKCRVKRCTEEDDGTYSCDLEAKGMKMGSMGTKEDAGDGLDKALSKIEKDKIAKEAYDEREAIEEEKAEKAVGDTDDE